MRGLSAPRTSTSASSTSTSRPGSTGSGVGSGDTGRFTTSCPEADHLPPAPCQVMLPHVPECGLGSSSCTAGESRLVPGLTGACASQDAPWSGLGDWAALRRRPAYAPALPAALIAALCTHRLCRRPSSPLCVCTPDPPAALFAVLCRTPAVTGLRSASGLALYGLAAPKRPCPLPRPSASGGTPSWTSTARYPGGTGGPGRRRGRWDRLMPVGVDGGRPKVLNRTALGPTTGDKAHSPFGAY